MEAAEAIGELVADGEAAVEPPEGGGLPLTTVALVPGLWAMWLVASIQVAVCSVVSMSSLVEDE